MHCNLKQIVQMEVLLKSPSCKYLIGTISKGYYYIDLGTKDTIDLSLLGLNDSTCTCTCIHNVQCIEWIGASALHA